MKFKKNKKNTKILNLLKKKITNVIFFEIIYKDLSVYFHFKIDFHYEYYLYSK